MSVRAAVARIGGTLEILLWRSAALFLLVGIGDLVWQNHRYTKQLKMSKHDRVLVVLLVDRSLGCFLEFGRSGKIGKPLRKIHRAAFERAPRHLADHRLGEMSGFCRNVGWHRTPILRSNADVRQSVHKPIRLKEVSGTTALLTSNPLWTKP